MLPLPMRVSGQHKIWALDSQFAAAASAALRPAEVVYGAKVTSSAQTSKSLMVQSTALPPGLSASSAPPGLRPCAAPFEPPGLRSTSATVVEDMAAYSADFESEQRSGSMTPSEPLDLWGVGAEVREPSPLPSVAVTLSADRRKRLSVLQDGLVLLRGALTIDVQQTVVDLCRNLGIGASGFYQPKTRGGAMHLQMMCLGDLPLHQHLGTSHRLPPVEFLYVGTYLS